MTFPPDLKVTSEVLWRATVIFLFLDAGCSFLILRRINAPLFRDFKWMLVLVTGIFWGLMWTVMAVYLWDPVYQYVFPEWSRWFIPPIYALLFAFISLFFWWIALRWRGNPVLTFLLLGGLWGSLTHTWAIYRGILDKPPMLQGAAPLPVIVFPFFEFVLYWCMILALTSFAFHKLHTLRTSITAG